MKSIKKNTNSNNSNASYGGMATLYNHNPITHGIVTGYIYRCLPCSSTIGIKIFRKFSVLNFQHYLCSNRGSNIFEQFWISTNFGVFQRKSKTCFMTFSGWSSQHDLHLPMHQYWSISYGQTLNTQILWKCSLNVEVHELFTLLSKKVILKVCLTLQYTQKIRSYTYAWTYYFSAIHISNSYNLNFDLFLRHSGLLQVTSCVFTIYESPQNANFYKLANQVFICRVRPWPSGAVVDVQLALLVLIEGHVSSLYSASAGFFVNSTLPLAAPNFGRSVSCVDVAIFSDMMSSVTKWILLRSSPFRNWCSLKWGVVQAINRCKKENVL